MPASEILSCRILISNAIIKGSDDEAISYLKDNLQEYNKNISSFDENGKTPLHVAAAVGRNRVLCWLLSHGADINIQDKESGYTPLHTAIFYGNFHTAIFLLERGADACKVDNEGYSPLELITQDQPKKSRRENINRQIYGWGKNTNYNLGYASKHSFEVPEFIEWHKSRLNIEQVAMNKFHSAFVTDSGLVYMCGHGLGGRLGLNSEDSVIIPERIRTFKTKVIKVSLGQDHSIFLTEDNMVWTCGLNQFNQLGHSEKYEKLTQPRVLRSWQKRNLDIKIKGVGASIFHSAFWSDDYLLTFGLNGGQLGHIKVLNEMYITTPRQVTLFPIKSNIECVNVGETVIVVATNIGSIYTLYDYQIRCIASKLGKIEKVESNGGCLDSLITNQLDIKRSSSDLTIAVLNKDGRLYLWTESSLRLLECCFLGRAELIVKDFCYHGTSFLIVTKDYSVFSAIIKNHKLKTRHDDDYLFKFKSFKTHYILELKRVPVLHRAMSIYCDTRWNNFIVLQYEPREFRRLVPVVEDSSFEIDFYNLFTDINDETYDTILELANKTFSTHYFILASHSRYFSKLLAASHSKDDDDTKVIKVNEGGKKVLALPDEINCEIFKEILEYIYTGSCKLSIPRKCDAGYILENINDTLKAVNILGIVSLEKQLEPLRNSSRESKSRMFRSLCAFIQGQKEFKRDLFHREKLIELCDIEFMCQDGKTLKAHKCILSARSEYFAIMLSRTWLQFESKSCASISLPFKSKIVEAILDYLYSDTAPELLKKCDLDTACCLLAASHQMLLPRLQQFCQIHIAELVNFKNSFDLVAFADSFNCESLKNCIMEFICLNMVAFFEMRTLSAMSPEMLFYLSECYKHFILNQGVLKDDKKENTIETSDGEYGSVEEFLECHFKKYESDSDDSDVSDGYKVRCSYMSRRILKPYSSKPSVETLRDILNEIPYIREQVEEDWIEEQRKLEKSYIKHKRISSEKWNRNSRSESEKVERRRRSSASSQNSCSSNSELELSQDFDDNKIFSFDDLVEKVPHIDDVNTSNKIEKKNACFAFTIDYSDWSSQTSEKMPKFKSKSKIKKEAAAVAAAEAAAQMEKSIHLASSPWRNSCEPTISLVDIMKSECEATPLKPKVNLISLPPKSKPTTYRHLDDSLNLSESLGSHKSFEFKGWNHPKNVEQVPPLCDEDGSFVGAVSLDNNYNLSSIMAEEASQHKLLKKAATKPLHLIQLEERAISELTEYYGGLYNPEERITVTRVQHEVEKPSWKVS